MATNFYFNNFQSSQEQSLIEDLVIESIRIYGHDVYYLPRTVVTNDAIFQEDDISSYDEATMIEVYIKNVDGFAGEGDFMSKFGLEIRDEMTLTVAKRVYEDELYYSGVSNNKRPAEGDLIYFPLNRKVFQIKFVEHEAVFYQMGKLQMYDMVVELFEYSDEEFNTDVTVIDNIEKDYSQSQTIYLTATTGDFTVGEIISQQLPLDSSLYKTATGTATISDGAITAVTLSSSGYGYTSTPGITFVGGSGTAAATAVMNGDRVSSVTVNVPGTGYSNTTVTFSAPATSTITGEIISITANTETSNAVSVEVINVKSQNINYANFVNTSTVTGANSNSVGTVTSTIAESTPAPTQSDSFQTISSDFLDFSESDPFSEGGSY